MNKYAENKPKDCNLCMHWNESKKSCGLGCEDNCYYLLEEPEKAPSPCDGCPYGKGHEFCFPCWKKLLGQGGIQ